MRFLVAGVIAMGCGGGQEPRSSDPLAIETLTDTNPDPAVVEVDLVAGPAEVEILDGKTTPVWAYRDGATGRATVPGPLLEVNQGDEVVVHFRNELPEETTIHWHGPRKQVGTSASGEAGHEQSHRL